MKIVVLDADTLGFESAAWDGLAGLGELVLRPNTEHSAEAVLAEVEGAKVVLTNKVPLRREVLEKCDSLKLISVLATGTNNIDVEVAKSCGITVCNVPAYSSASVAQHTAALLLELCNHCGLHSESVHAGDWVHSAHFCYWKKPLIELTGLTVGLVGFGDIGRRTATILHAMGVRIQACVRHPRDAPDWDGFRWVERAALFATSDIVSLHCPETPETRGFVDEALLRSMKPGALLVNTARGSLIDEAALASALKSGQVGGAALDVVSAEPMRTDNPLRGAPNCIITPHLAWASEPSRRRLLGITQENIEGFIDGRPRHVINYLS